MGNLSMHNSQKVIILLQDYSPFTSLFPSSSPATSLKSLKEPESTGKRIEKQTWGEVTSGFPCNNSFWKSVVSENFDKDLATLSAVWILSKAQEWAASETMVAHSVVWQMSEYCVFKCPVALTLEIVRILQRQRHCSWKCSHYIFLCHTSHKSP